MAGKIGGECEEINTTSSDKSGSADLLAKHSDRLYSLILVNV